MRYSFVKSRKKYLFDSASKVWFSFMLVMCLFLGGFKFFLDIKINNLQNQTKNSYKIKKDINSKMNNINHQTKFILQQNQIANDVYSSNTLLAESIKNLFDLVPDQITLKKVEISKTELVIYGITPSKDVYNFLLESPLKSIFNQSEKMFYMLPNGWYRFVSVNKLEETMEE